MTTVATWQLFALVLGASAVLVGVVRRLVVAHGVLDHPTDRSSHVIPTPRGGGLGAIAAILLGLLAIDGTRHDARLVAMVVAAAAIAAVGWFDDRRGMPVGTRLLVHLLAGITVGVLALDAALPLPYSVALFAWWTFWTVSSINVVNFMDGINGLIASQVAMFGASLVAFGDGASLTTRYAVAVTAGCVGFLPWNFPRARIFLGDAGSGALGFLVAGLGVLAMREHRIDVVQAYLPLLPLFGDATITIVRRWHRGERLTEAHRSHLYQRLANGGMGHARVTLLFGAASLAGALAAHLAYGAWRWPIVLGYVIGVLAFAAYLERWLARRSRRGEPALSARPDPPAARRG